MIDKSEMVNCVACRRKLWSLQGTHRESRCVDYIEPLSPAKPTDESLLLTTLELQNIWKKYNTDAEVTKAVAKAQLAVCEPIIKELRERITTDNENYQRSFQIWNEATLKAEGFIRADERAKTLREVGEWLDKWLGKSPLMNGDLQVDPVEATNFIAQLKAGTEVKK